MITFSEKAYQCPDDKSSASSPLFDWSEITNLCKLYAAALSEDSHVQKSLINHFESKLRTHQLDKETLRGLNLIYQELLNSKTSNDRKTQIALILQERVEHCTPGFSNGIFFITTQIKSKTLQDCLYQIRFDIVNKVAREYSDDVHQVNSFFSAAQKLGLGVKANNDIYSNDNFEVNRLRNAFKSEYHFLNILNKISEDIHTNFNLNKDRPDLFQA